MTDRKNSAPDEGEAEAIALKALIWTLADEKRAERLLSLTGLTPDRLRAGLSERGVQAAILEYLSNYEPDLIAFADAEGLGPNHIVAAGRTLGSTR